MSCLFSQCFPFPGRSPEAMRSSALPSPYLRRSFARRNEEKAKEEWGLIGATAKALTTSI
ncbi:MAG: hypothetical protein MJZ77_05950 [Bacteroidales bacterium]|nr:hypothetical protein [Bacteroidales bacterium]